MDLVVNFPPESGLSEHHLKGDASGLHPAKVKVLERLRNRIVFTAILLFVAFLSLTLLACSDSSAPTTALLSPPQVQPLSEQVPEPTVSIDTHAEDGHSIKFTDSNRDIWPPQPEDITDVVNIIEAVQYTSDITNLALKEQSLRALSPNHRHEILIQNIMKRKNGDAKHIESEVYDYDTNQVITIHFDSSGTEIVKRSTNDAQNYQPPESPAEVSRAIELATLDLVRQGFTDLKDLSGTGLLAYPSATESAATGANFYSQRKIYVTFGHGNGELPHYRALVNLSTNTVESSGAIQ